MSYSIHVHRRDFWADDSSAARDIALDEWRKCIGELASLEPVGPISGAWVDTEDGDVLFEWHEGVVSVDARSPAAVHAASVVASRLGARVQGDDGEWYGPAEQGSE